MLKESHKNNACCQQETESCREKKGELLPIYRETSTSEVCCGPPPGPAGSPFEKPGYTLCRYVDDFIETPAGLVPRVKTDLEKSDIIGTINVRLGLNRNHYQVAPGLYAVGQPDSTSPVLVTANYKLSFDTLRKQLKETQAWILVLDTRGVNVWCAAGKKTFSTAEVNRQVKRTRLDSLVSHKKLLLPQLSATGVSAKQVKKGCGFKVVWGPVRATDIQAFIKAGMKADTAMRRVTFSFWERLVLVPVELSFLRKYLLWMLAAAFLISGIDAGIFSLSRAWSRGLIMMTAFAAGILAGTVVAPVLLPWIPGKAFSIKGVLTGLVFGVGVMLSFQGNIGWLEATALMLIILSISSYLAMNFTGSTPYTSPSGVEKEMRLAIPFQAAAVFISVIGWIGSAFV